MPWWAKGMFREIKWLDKDCALDWSVGNSLGIEKECGEATVITTQCTTGTWKKRGDMKEINSEQSWV